MSTAQVVVITGASAGVGRAVAREYARRGARIGLIARGEAGLRATLDECQQLGASSAASRQCDIADAEALASAARGLASELGEPDVWINNAMVSVFAPSWEITPREYARVTEVNYLGTVYGTLAALETMRARGRGNIVQVGSALAYRGIPFQAAYCASKHAVQGFVDSLRSELLREYPGITVGMVQLPAINTPQFSWVRTRLPRHPRPMGKVFPPEEAAKAIVYAADKGLREITVGGPTVKARLVNAVAPGWFDRMLARDGYSGQQTADPVDLRSWRDNVDSPLDTEQDYGAEGVFGDDTEQHPPLRVPGKDSVFGALAASGLAMARSVYRFWRPASR